MKLANTLIKLAAAAAAVAGIAYLVVRYFDDIKAWISRVFPCCDYSLEDDFEDFDCDASDFEGAEAAAAEEAADKAEEATDKAEEEAAEADDAVTAEEEDFEA